MVDTLARDQGEQEFGFVLYHRHFKLLPQLTVCSFGSKSVDTIKSGRKYCVLRVKIEKFELIGLSGSVLRNLLTNHLYILQLIKS